MLTATTEGFGKGLVERSYPLSNQGIPALNSFYFRFGRAGSPVDNQLQYIMMLPGGRSRDMTPTADLAPSSLAAGRLDLGFKDDDPDSAKDEYFYRASHVMLPGQFARRFQFRDVGDSGIVRRQLPPGILSASGPAGAIPSILVLAGFKLFYTGNREHDVDQISVMLETDGTYTVALNDKNNDDVFAYLIDVVRISGVGLNITDGEASGSARGAKSIDTGRPAGTDLVLRGFDFDFVTRDRHLRDIGVVRRHDKLDLFFGDRTPDDLFRWKVSWAHVGSQLVAPA